MDYDKTQIPDAYNRGRDHGPAVLNQWMNVVAAAAEPLVVRRILDLGCGTGRFANGLAERFDAGVVGLDPSQKMLAQTRTTPARRNVCYAGGLAECLPLADASVDLIFISMAFHHFTDPALAARECARVLRPGGRLCLRTAARELISEYPYVPYFPASCRLLEERLPTLSFQQETFEQTGLSMFSSQIVVQEVAADLSAYAEKLAVKADSILASLDPADFDSGMEALRSAAVSRTPRAVTEPINFLVFGKLADI